MMSRVFLLVLVGLIAATVVTGRSTKTSTTCGRHGDSCVSARDCCPTLRCHSYAHACQVVITSEELMAQREKILGRRGKDN